MTEAVCVFCRRRPVDETWRPFCSERCKLLDLAQWADGTYRVAGENMDDARETENLEERTQHSKF